MKKEAARQARGDGARDGQEAARDSAGALSKEPSKRSGLPSAVRARLTRDRGRRRARPRSSWTSKGNEHAMRLTTETMREPRPGVRREVARYPEGLCQGAEAPAGGVRTSRRMKWDQVYQQRSSTTRSGSSRAVDHARRCTRRRSSAPAWRATRSCAQAEAVDAQTIEQKVAVEQRKMEIEVDYLQKIHEIKMELFDLETSTPGAPGRIGVEAARLQGRRDRARIAELRAERRRDPQASRRSEATTTPSPRRGRTRAIRQAQMIRDEQPADLRLPQAAGGRRVRRAAVEVAVGVVRHRQLVQDRDADGHQGRGHVARGGHADADVHRHEGVACRRRRRWRWRRWLALARRAWPASARSRCSAAAAGRSLAAWVGGWSTPPFLPGGSAAGGATGGAGGAGSLLSGAGLAGSLAGLKSFAGHRRQRPDRRRHGDHLGRRHDGPEALRDRASRTPR